MTDAQLYETYAAWTGQLHFYADKYLGRHIDAEYFPAIYEFRLYSGEAKEKELAVWGFSTVPSMTRPLGEATVTIKLPRPEDNPTPEQLEEVFRGICMAAARVLAIDLGKPKLEEPKPNGPVQKSMLKHALPKQLKRRKK
jgi:hypothetical protein